MIKIDPVIIQALKNAIAKYGTVLSFSNELGISHSTVLFWLSGKIHHISADIWQNKLYHNIEYELAAVCPHLTAAEIREKYYFHLSVYKPVRVPVIYEDDLIRYEMPMEDIGSFAARYSRRKIYLESNPQIQSYGALLFNNMFKYGIPWHTLIIFTKHVRFVDKIIVIVKFQDDLSLHICKVSISSANNILFSNYLTGKDEGIMGADKKIDWAFPVSEIRYLCRDPRFIKQDSLRSSLTGSL